jgi:outer membrane protein OmpA-like peptidoglycan-associated protein
MQGGTLVTAFAALALGACEIAQAPPPPTPTDTGWVNVIAFFDFDSAALTEQARQNLTHIARAALDGRQTPVRVTGHADRSGPDTYNIDLSRRRAEAVREGLMRLGVPAERIQLEWLGKSRPLVNTPDGDREPLNRYAILNIY